MRRFWQFLAEAYRGCHPSTEIPPEAVEIGAGGSQRRFFRLGDFPRSIVGMLSADPPADRRGVTENDSFTYVAGHLALCGVNVPRVLDQDLHRGWFALEDAGKDLLYDVLSRMGECEETLALYESTVSQLVKIQAGATAGFDPSRTHNTAYDGAFARRSESGYFQEWFLERGLSGGILPGAEKFRFPPGLPGDLDRMAGALGSINKRVLVHRDFQSQNVVVGGRGARVIDFQGARLGPPQYDVASLLYDPYARLTKSFRDRLMGAYAVAAAAAGADTGGFLELFPAVAAHRLMQALGAYGFLTLERGKAGFSQHVSSAVDTLAQLVDEYVYLLKYQYFTHTIVELRRLARRKMS